MQAILTADLFYRIHESFVEGETPALQREILPLCPVGAPSSWPKVDTVSNIEKC